MGAGGAEALGGKAEAPPPTPELPVPQKGSRAWVDVGGGNWALGTLLAVSPGTVSIALDEGGRQLDNVPTAAVQPANPPGFDVAHDLTALSHLNHPSLLHALRTRYDDSAIHTWAGEFSVHGSGNRVSSCWWVQVHLQPLRLADCTDYPPPHGRDCQREWLLVSAGIPDAPWRVDGPFVPTPAPAGPVLVVLNPYRALPGAYDEASMRDAAARSAGAERRPEGEPHTFLVADSAYRRMVEYGQPQSILVSGELR